MKNFTIDKNKGIISEEFFNKNILDFHSASKFVSKLPYKRNVNKNNIKCVFDDLGGTCSTKHAILRKLALENHYTNVKLILGIFKMDSIYTFKIKETLNKFNLNYIPEAHNYLKIDNELCISVISNNVNNNLIIKKISCLFLKILSLKLTEKYLQFYLDGYIIHTKLKYFGNKTIKSPLIEGATGI